MRFVKPVRQIGCVSVADVIPFYSATCRHSLSHTIVCCVCFAREGGRGMCLSHSLMLQTPLHASAVKKYDQKDDVLRLKIATEAARFASETMALPVCPAAITWSATAPRRNLGIRAPPSLWFAFFFFLTPPPLFFFFFFLSTSFYIS